MEITSLTVPRTAEASQRLSEVEDALRDRLDRGGAAWTLTISADVPPPNLDSAGLVRQQRAAIVEAASDLALEGGGTLDRRALSSSGVESVRELTLERGEAGVSVCLLTDGSHDLSQLRSVFASALEKKRSRR